MEQTEIIETLQGLSSMQAFIEESITEDENYDGEMDELLELIVRVQSKLATIDSLDPSEKEALEGDISTLSEYLVTLNKMVEEPEELDLCQLRI